MLGLAGMLALVAGAAEVSLAVQPPVPCVTAAGLTKKLRASGLTIVERPGARTLSVTARGEGRQLKLNAQRGAMSFARTVPADPNDCAAVERVAVALIGAWAQSASVPAEPADAGPPDFQTPPVKVQEEKRSPPEPEVVVAPPPIREERPPVPPEEVRDASVPELVDAGVAVEAFTIDAGTPLPPPVVDDAPLLRVEAAVLGGVSVGGTPVTTAAGSVLAAFSSGRWGALIEAGLESERATREDPIRVSATMQWLAISFRVSFEPLERLSLDLALGARGWRVTARATGVVPGEVENALTAGPALSAGASWRVYGPLHVHLRPSVAWRVHQLSLSVEPLGPLLLLERWTVGVTLGALLRFE